MPTTPSPSEPASEMRPEAVREARSRLGELWGFGRPLYAAELARALRLRGRDPGQTVLRWETGKAPVSGPASVAIEMMLAGAVPPDHLEGASASEQ
jgi:hypothetical protein